MDRSEPALVPEWLKSSGSAPTGGNANHLSALASLHFDDPVSKHVRNKSSLSGIDRDTHRPSVLERTTSAYFCRSSSSNGSAHMQSPNSFGRSQHDRYWEDVSDYHDREKLVLGDHRHYEHSDPLANILPSKSDKDKLRASQSMIIGKQDDTWSKKVSGDFNNPNKTKHINSSGNGNGMLARVGVGTVHDNAFEQDFPSLGVEESQGGIGRISSPGLSAAIQTGTSPVVGSDSWKSALVEVPAVPATSASMVPNITTGLNMAEALAQGTPRACTPPQSTAGIQRFEELAIRQSKLIPMTSSIPKTLVVSPSEKMKPKIGLQQHSGYLANHIRGAARSDGSKISNECRLQVLKPSRELNGIYSAVKDISSPTNGSKAVNGPLVTAAGSIPLRSSGNSPNHAIADRHPSVFQRPTVEKRPTLQVQSRNDFFNHLKKKSSANATSGVSDPSLVPLSSISDKSVDSVTEVIAASVPEHGGDSCSSVTDSDGRGKIVHDGDSYCSPHQFDNREKDLNTDATPNPDEEEAAFLRSLGWDENAGEDGLTEEEIRAFYEEYMKKRPSSELLNGMRPATTLDSYNSSCTVASSGTKLI